MLFLGGNATQAAAPALKGPTPGGGALQVHIAAAAHETHGKRERHKAPTAPAPAATFYTRLSGVGGLWARRSRSVRGTLGFVVASGYFALRPPSKQRCRPDERRQLKKKKEKKTGFKNLKIPATAVICSREIRAFPLVPRPFCWLPVSNGAGGRGKRLLRRETATD